MEECIKKFAETLEIRDEKGRMYNYANKRSSLNLIRYADDFVILHKEHSVVQSCREIISEWLNDMGLELKLSKTRLSHTLHNVGREKAGFDFLGFNISQVKVGKYSSGKHVDKLLMFKTLIKPSKKSIRSHYQQLVDIINNSNIQASLNLLDRGLKQLGISPTQLRAVRPKVTPVLRTGFPTQITGGTAQDISLALVDEPSNPRQLSLFEQKAVAGVPPVEAIEAVEWRNGRAIGCSDSASTTSSKEDTSQEVGRRVVN